MHSRGKGNQEWLWNGKVLPLFCNEITHISHDQKKTQQKRFMSWQCNVSNRHIWKNHIKGGRKRNGISARKNVTVAQTLPDCHDVI